MTAQIVEDLKFPAGNLVHAVELLLPEHFELADHAAHVRGLEAEEVLFADCQLVFQNAPVSGLGTELLMKCVDVGGGAGPNGGRAASSAYQP